MEALGTIAKPPELLGQLEEVNKAVDGVRLITSEICEWLRVGVNKDDDKSQAPLPVVSLINQRASHLSCLRQQLHDIRGNLETILSAVQDI